MYAALKHYLVMMTYACYPTSLLVIQLLTLVKKHPGKKYSTMVMDTTMPQNSAHTTMVRVDGREHELKRQSSSSRHYRCTSAETQHSLLFVKKTEVGNVARHSSFWNADFSTGLWFIMFHTVCFFTSVLCVVVISSGCMAGVLVSCDVCVRCFWMMAYTQLVCFEFKGSTLSYWFSVVNKILHSI